MAASTKCSLDVLPHPPYSSYLASLDFRILPNLKTNLRGRNFGCNEGVIDAVDGTWGTRKEASVLKE